MSSMRSAMAMPAACMRAIFSVAVSSLPSTIVPAWPKDMPGMSFGHAGTIVEGKEDTATEKIARLAEAGITVAEEISQIPEIMKSKLAERSPA